MFVRRLCYCIVAVSVPPLVPLCRGEAGLLVTSKYGYFCNLFPLLPVVGIFSPLSSSSAFLRSLFQSRAGVLCT